MRTSILSFSFITLFSSFFPLVTCIANNSFSFQDHQLLPKSFVTRVPPPLYSPEVVPPSREIDLSTQKTPAALPMEGKRILTKKRDYCLSNGSCRRKRYTNNRVGPVMKKKVAKKGAPPVAKRHRHCRHAIVYSGSLRANIERIAAAYGWYQVVWRVPEDYRWIGKTRIVAHDIVGIFAKLLNSYPLQAQFYKGNHVLVIISRTVR